MTTALRTALIWHDEVMNDLVLDKPQAVTLGPGGRTTFVIPDLGLPPRFAIVRPRNRGYVLTLGERMRGTICVGGQEHDVAELVTREADKGGFCAATINRGDWGVIELDPSGHYKVFFQFVSVDDPPQFFTRPVLIAGGIGYALSSAALTLLWYLKGIEIDEAAFRGFGLAALAMLVGGIAWSMVRQDSESQASLAFSVVLHAALLFMTYQLYDGENPFVWPGPRSLTGNYLVTRLDKEEPPEPKPVPTVSGKSQQPQMAAAATKEPPKNTATKGEEGRAGGKGETERARDPNAKDVPPEPPKVQFFEDKNKKILDNIIDRNLSTSLSKFTGIKGDTLTRGSMGFGPGAGTGVGPGEGTGTRSGSKKGGSGGGGNVEGDFVSGPGKIDTGANRPGGGNCKGGGCGTGPRAVQVGFAEPAGDFGGLTAEEIDRVVKARAGIFRACYQKELNHTPGIGGKLVIHFKIGGDGTVQAGNTSTAGGSTLRNDAVESCVKSNVNRLRFPAKGGIANVNYPFVFTQGG
ncbi:MAG TPA: AgmX/PglI C-terminal domain-containing protein [Kofleriaceae bacterium]|nr:AgmX/PglI C-terminal domain-containing protein [Kofleriaceae bacterium]